MEKLKQKLSEEVQQVLELLYNAQENYKIFKFLTKEFTDVDERFVVSQNFFWFITHDSCLNQVILNLSKLFNGSRREQFNIFNFIDKFRSGEEYSELKIPEDKINHWYSLLKKHQTKINAIIEIRNKKIAHKDIIEPRLNTSKADINSLIESAQGVFQSIYFEVWNTHLLIHEPLNSPVENLKDIIKILAKDRSKALSGIRALEKKHHII